MKLGDLGAVDDLVEARTVVFGARARFFAHAAPARFLASSGLLAGILPKEVLPLETAHLVLAAIVWAWAQVLWLILLVAGTALLAFDSLARLVCDAIASNSDANAMLEGVRSPAQQVIAIASNVLFELGHLVDSAISGINGAVRQIAPEVVERLALATSGALVVFLVCYLICSWLVYGLSSNIRGVAGSQWSLLASLPQSVANELTALHRERQPFIVCRKACHSYFATAWAFFLGKEAIKRLRRWAPRSWGLFNQMNYAIAIATVRALGVKLWPYDEEKFFADVTTDRAQQKSVANDHDQYDLELRFVQDEPQRPFSGGDLSKPIYSVFQCLLNPIHDPVWVLPLSDVMKRLEDVCARPDLGLSFDAVVQTLSFSNFPTFRRIERDPQAGIRVKAAEDPFMPILRVGKNVDDTPRYLSGYDENNILYFQVPQPPQVRKSLLAFQLALDEAARRDAVRIDLEGGDMLLIRNQEAFYCRRESEDHWIHSMTFLPRARWLRRYMAFDVQSERESRPGSLSSSSLAAMTRIRDYAQSVTASLVGRR